MKRLDYLPPRNTSVTGKRLWVWNPENKRNNKREYFGTSLPAEPLVKQIELWADEHGHSLNEAFRVLAPEIGRPWKYLVRNFNRWKSGRTTKVHLGTADKWAVALGSHIDFIWGN